MGTCIALNSGACGQELRDPRQENKRMDGAGEATASSRACRLPEGAGKAIAELGLWIGEWGEKVGPGVGGEDPASRQPPG